MSGMKAFSALAASERSFFSYLFISLFLRVVVARVEVPIRPGRVHGGSGRCPNPTGRSVGCGGSCRCLNPTGQNVGCGSSDRCPNPTLLWLISMSQSDEPKSSVSRLMSQSNRPVLLVVGAVVVGFVIHLCGFWARFTYK